MPSLHVQDFLRFHQKTNPLVDPVEALGKLYAIKAKAHGKYPNLVQLKYDQIDSPMGNPIVQECRGLILDRDKNWAIIAHPFHKFFNSEEGHAAKIDWSTARVQEKVDGSLIIMYHHDGKWHVATSGTPDASGAINGLPMTFEKLFWETVFMEGSKSHYWAHEDPNSISPDITFMWELTSPYNRIVVQHPKPKLTLIGMRNRVTGEEYDVATSAPPGAPIVKHFDLTSLEAIGNSFSTISALNQEGYVVVDASFNRVKIKHPQYVALHHLKGEGSTPSTKGALAVVRQGEMEELLSYWPEWAPIFTEVRERYENLVTELETAYQDVVKKVPPVPPGVVQTDKRAQGLFRKEFATLATKTRVPAVMFSLLDGKAKSVREFLVGMQIDHLASVLKLDEIKIDPQVIFGKVTP
jgi:hypothetical protein